MTGDEHASYFGQFVAPMGDQATTGNAGVIASTTGDNVSNNHSSQTIDTASGTTQDHENRRNIIIIQPEGQNTAGTPQQLARPPRVHGPDNANASRAKAVATGTAQQPNSAPDTRTQRECGDESGTRNDDPEDDPFRAAIVSRLDDLVDDFRKDNASQMETLYQILSTLLDAGLDEEDRRARLEEYTLYIDIIASKHKDAERRGVEMGDRRERVGDGEATVGQDEQGERAVQRTPWEEEVEHLL